MSDVIERLRAAKPDCPPPPIQPLWRRLEEEEHDNTSSHGFVQERTSGVRWRPTVLGVVLAVMSTGTLAVGVLFLVALGHGHTPAVTSTAGASTASRPPLGRGLRDGRQARRRRSAIEHARTNHVAPVLLANFAVFDAANDRTSGVGPEAGLTVSRPTTAALPFGVVGSSLPGRPDYRQVRQVSTEQGLVFFIIPGASDVCITAYYRAPRQSITADSAPGACAANLAQVEQTGMWQTFQLPNGPRLLYGFVPRTNTSITLTMVGGTTKRTPVLDGVVVASAAGVTRIHVKGVSGHITTSLGPDAT